MRFTTISGSIYEVDRKNKKIRRLNGNADPTPRQGKDGEWRGYLNELHIEVGQPVVIAWADAHQLTEETMSLLGISEKEAPPPMPGRTTFTSRVVEIDDKVYH